MTVWSRGLVVMFLVLTLSVPIALHADQKKLTDDQRVEILRGLSAEYAKCKVPLPKSAKPLDFQSDGTWDKQHWADLYKQLGPPAASATWCRSPKSRSKKTKSFSKSTTARAPRAAGRTTCLSAWAATRRRSTAAMQANAPSGTTIALKFGEPIGTLTSADVKKIMAPVLEFDKQTVTEQYVDTIPPEFKQAIAEKKPIEGMDRDQVRMALGQPVRKSREMKDGVEIEDWIYGNPPGKVMFVTFAGPKVIKVKETYAGLGGSIADSPKEP